MSVDAVISRLLRELTELVAKEHDPEKLRELVVGMNRVLDAIEEQIATLEGDNDSSVN